MSQRPRDLARSALFVIALFVAAWLPRVVALDHFVTPDEPRWLVRSANFTHALTSGALADTYQIEHPGVTVMWAGLLGLAQSYPDYATDAPAQFTWDQGELEEWLDAGGAYTPLDLLASARWWITLLISLVIAACFFPLRSLLGDWPAFLAALFVAWDPFFIALSRQLHPDGLLAALSLLALLAFLAWLHAGQRYRELALSGFVAGLAFITKAPAVFLAITVGLLTGIGWFGERRQTRRAPGRRLWIGLLLWGGIALLTAFVLWPALWVDPLDTVSRTIAGVFSQRGGHVNDNFFLGEITADPGLFFYPVAFLWRTTPFVLIGLVAALWLSVVRRPPSDAARVRRTLFGLVFFVLIYWLGMSRSAKQFDRYFLPAILALDVIAAIGWFGIARWVSKRLQRPAFSYALVTVALLLHAALGLRHAPYYLTYYNPLAGGASTARDVLMVGWGEGLDEAAHWLNAQPDAENLRVVSWYDIGPFSYFFEGETGRWSYAAPLAWLDTDFVVLYVNQLQRDIPNAETLAHFTQHEPAHVVSANGLDLAYIYDMRDTLMPDFVEIDDTRVADFDGQIRLAAIELEERQIEPGDALPVTFHLQAVAPIDKNVNLLAQVVGSDGAVLWREEGWPWGAPTAQWPLREIRPDRREIVVPADAASGLYKLTLAFYDPETLDLLPATVPNSDRRLVSGTLDLALIRVETPGSGTTNEGSQMTGENPDTAAAWRLGDVIELTGAELPQSSTAGALLSLTLHWRSLQQTPYDYTVFVHIVGPDGTMVAQQDGPPLSGFAPTSVWRSGDDIVDAHAIPLPDDLAQGSYVVRVGLYTAEDGRLPLTQSNQPAGDAAEIGMFTLR